MIGKKRRSPTLGVYRIVPEAVLPTRATAGSACLDVSACIVPGRENLRTIHGYGPDGREASFYCGDDRGVGYVSVFAGGCLLIPTGIVLDIPAGYSVRVHQRSSMVKRGLMLANCEGIVDHDYTGHLFLPFRNMTTSSHVIKHGERLAQIELVECVEHHVVEIDSPPVRDTDRRGGFGSTGK